MAISDLDKQWKGYGEQFGKSSSRVNEVYKCDWSDRDTNQTALLAGAGYTHSDYSYLKCTSVSIAPAGDPDTSSGGPKSAFLTATYVDDDSAISRGGTVNNDLTKWNEHWEGSGEAITIGKGYAWSDAVVFANCTKIKTEDDVSAVKIFPSAAITLNGSSDRVDSDAKIYILNLIGKVNTAVFRIKGYNYAAQKLLFLGGDLQEGTDNVGGSVYNITYKFLYKHTNTWNDFWNKKKKNVGGNPAPGFNKMIDADINSPYTSGVFSDLDPANW